MTEYNKDLIIQWNPNGLVSKITEIKQLLTKFKPICIAIQETRLKENFNFQLKHHTTFRKDYILGGNASGGVALLINEKFHTEPVQLNTELQITAARVMLKNFKNKVLIQFLTNTQLINEI